MIGTLISKKDVMIGKRSNVPALEIKLRKPDDEVKSYSIPKFQEGLIAQFQDIEIGDNIDLKFKQNEKGYMNPDSVGKYDGPMDSGPPNRGAKSGYSGGGRWTPDPSKNRGVALSYALQYVLPTFGDKIKTYEEYVETAITIAELMVPYLESGPSPFKNDDDDTDIPEPNVED